MFTRIIIVVLMLFILEFLISCPDCGCPGTQEFEFQIVDINVYNIDNSGENPIIQEEAAISKIAYGIRINVIFSEPVPRNNYVTDFLTPSKAFAAVDCFCPDEFQYYVLDTITSIKIITINDFDGKHPAGSDISNYFRYREYNSYISIKEYVKMEDVVYLEKKTNQVTDFFLLTPPEEIGSRSFSVELNLSDGRQFLATSQRVILE